MKNYLTLANKILVNGNERSDRTGTGTLSLFGEQLKFNLEDGFPLITTKKMFFKGIIGELIWMLSGETNIKFLQDNNIHIWDAWSKNNDVGKVYGYQWRNFNGQNIDQIKNVIESIKNYPTSRRHLVVSYNPAQINEMSLPPCPSFFQFYVNNNKLSLHLYQISADLFLGVPFDIAVYALLLNLIALECGLLPFELIISYGDTHIYLNHIEQMKKQVSREPYKLPNIGIKKKDIFNYTFEDIQLIDYKFHNKINGEISI